ncbi:hypothetical protein [Marinobacter zhejiangensis]|uniref:Lipoprotein n=1 Tax=Marinobacter zhejiangensis TaxID=488535 RepID=A0A1I4Q4L5_9GAMM|nr:hypothetical protein [Marinobacter zhejiangensis]SFM34590.1 hypothetical protein SAMN04487963_2157 [Marinobacter zhejiangensis]
MKKAVFSAALSVFALTGCQTSGYVSSAATDGNGVTCDKIYNAFDAYQSDKQSAKALADLTQLVNPTAGSMAQQGMSSADGYYEQIKASANIALAVRGCQPL